MKKLLSAALLVTSLITVAYAKDANQPESSVFINDSQLIEHGSYKNSKGNTVHAPAHSKSNAVPAGASAQCRDRTYSFSQSRRGTCSHHGGVASWL